MKASLQGFADYLNRAVPVSAGASVPLRVNKQKDGCGAGPFNPPETTWIQDGPSKT